MKEKDIMDMTDEEFEEYMNSLSEQGDDGESNDTPPQQEKRRAQEEPDDAQGQQENAPEEEPGTQQEKREPERTEEQTETPDDTLERLRDYAREKYPESSNPVGDLLEELESEMAVGSGMNLEDWRKNRADMREFETWKSEKQKKQQSDEEAQKIISEWESDAEKLKKFVPSFDLRQALSNDEFKKRLIAGEDVISAYAQMNPPKEETKEKEAGISEVGRFAASSALSAAQRDMSKAPKKEFDEYIRNIYNG